MVGERMWHAVMVLAGLAFSVGLAQAQGYTAPGYYGSGYPTFEGRPFRPPGALVEPGQPGRGAVRPAPEDDDDIVESAPAPSAQRPPVAGYVPGIRPPGVVPANPGERMAAPAQEDMRRGPISTGSVVTPGGDREESRGANGASVMSLPEEDQPEQGAPKELPPHLKRQLVNYSTSEPVGTIIVDTANTHLYLVLGNGQAMRYGIGVGREGFTWAGREKVSRKAEWPDWHPPQEMIERQPYLPRFMAGGPGNPMGARAMYLGKTVYRIHGTNQPSTIGKFVSSGCIRLVNEDVEDLFERVKVGSQVVVLAGPKPATAMPVSVAPSAGPVPPGPIRVEAAGNLPPVR